MTARASTPIVAGQAENNAASGAAQEDEMKNARTTTKITRIAATAVAVALTGFVGPAVAGAPVVKSELTVQEKDFNFKGKVASESHVCEARRLVKVYRINNGNEILVGQDKTDNSGSYKFDVNVFNGGEKHFAVAVLKETEKVTCKEAQTKKAFL
jgi:hypothetical protein